MFGRIKKIKHNWKPFGQPIVTEDGKVYVVEYCDKTGTYRYVRVPSYAQHEQMEIG